LKLIR